MQDPQSGQKVLVDTLVSPSLIVGFQLEMTPFHDSEDLVMPIQGAKGAPEVCWQVEQ